MQAGIAVASVVIDTPSPNTEDDIAYHFSALAEFMCQGDVVQWQASSHRVDQAVALEERAELGKAGVAIGSTEVVDEKKPKRDRASLFAWARRSMLKCRLKPRLFSKAGCARTN